jgi:hypothetical protein
MKNNWIKYKNENYLKRKEENPEMTEDDIYNKLKIDYERMSKEYLSDSDFKKEENNSSDEESKKELRKEYKKRKLDNDMISYTKEDFEDDWNMTDSDEESSKKEVKRKKKKNGWYIFVNENYLKIKEKNPEYKRKDIFQILSEKWKHTNKELYKQTKKERKKKEKKEEKEEELCKKLLEKYFLEI